MTLLSHRARDTQNHLFKHGSAHANFCRNPGNISRIRSYNRSRANGNVLETSVSI